MAKAQGDFSVNAQLQKKDFMDREAKVYLQVYNEIERAVSQFAREHGIAVVHRFDGDPVDSPGGVGVRCRVLERPRERGRADPGAGRHGNRVRSRRS